MSLTQTLQTHLQRHQSMPFIEFMQMALYDPHEGYYSSGLQKLGPKGDFTTAPELTSLFGKTLANQCEQIFAHLDKPKLFEFGAGTGKLCIDVLSHLDTLNSLPESYFILELSANLRHRQQELIKKNIPHLASKVKWLDTWPEIPFNGVVLANEVLDAMPIHRFLHEEGRILESYVQFNEQGQLCEHFKHCHNERLLNYIKKNLLPLPSPYLSEVNLFIDSWLLNIYTMINKGAVILIDYGFPRHEYYHPDRLQGTLMCHYQHKTQPNPLLNPGEQDISAHVDFTHVAEAGFDAGFHVAGYTNQASFLLANGLLSFIHDLKSEKEQVLAKQAIKQLTQPNEMGELFKVIALAKNLKIDLNGFLLHDKRVSL